MKMKKLKTQQSISLLIILLGASMWPVLAASNGEGIANQVTGKSELRLSIFSGKIKPGKLEDLSGKTVTLKYFTENFTPGALTAYIGRHFQGNLETLKLESNNKANSDATKNFDNINWLIGDFVVQISFPEGAGKKDSTEGRLSFSSIKTKQNHEAVFALKEGNSLLAYIGDGKSIVVAAVQRCPIKKRYSTQFRAGKFIIFSTDVSWTGKELTADHVLFTDAKAVIKTPDGDLVMTADTILFDKTGGKLFGKNATIESPKAKSNVSGKQIELTIDAPYSYKIK